MRNILRETDEVPTDWTTTRRKILKLGRYLQAQSSRGYEHIKDLRPGDDYVERSEARANNTHIPCATIADFKRRSRRAQTRKGLLFERFAERGIETLHRKILEDDLRG